MAWYDEKRAEVRKMIRESSLGVWDFVRIAKDICTCQYCEFFVQHYTKDGKQVEYGHCNRVKHRAKSPYEQSCNSFVAVDEMEQGE